MNRFLVFALLFVGLQTGVFAAGDVIQSGQGMTDVAKHMTNAGYKETNLAVMPEPGRDLKMWAVGEGVIIFAYSQKTGKIENIRYSLCDERPKAERKTFDFTVREFDPVTREMKIIVPKNSGSP